MSELKCPACKAPLSEPLPERCPVCQLEGINRMFLTLEDYEDWKKNVLDEHIKKLRNHKIFVGEVHVLVLMDDGTLFQIEGNKPAKVAENVKSVATGYNYSLYLDSASKVHFLGNSGISFKERFKQDALVFKKVFARLDIDIFGAEDIDGNFYVWGDNHSQMLEPSSKKLLYVPDEDFMKNFSSRNETYEYYSFGWVFNYSSKSLSQLLHQTCHEASVTFSKKDIQEAIRETDIYGRLAKLYGESNLEIESELRESHEKRFGDTLMKSSVNPKNRYTQTNKNSTVDYYYLPDGLFISCDDAESNLGAYLVDLYKNGKLKYSRHVSLASYSDNRGAKIYGPHTIIKRTFQAKVFLVNKYIFVPEPKPSTTAFKKFFVDPIPKYTGLKKFINIYKGDFEIYARLEKDSSLYVFRKESDGKLVKITTFKGIMDCSEYIKDCLYLIDYSNKIWCINLEKLLKLKQEIVSEKLLKFICEL